MYWPRFLLKNLYGIAVIGILLWAMIDSLVHRTEGHWRGIGALWAVIAVLFALAVFRTRRETAREFGRLNATLADWVTLGPDGITFDGPNGATAFQPWGNYKGWRPGTQVILVERSQGEGFTMLAFSQLSESERQVLQGILESHIRIKTLSGYV